jgi:transcriptional antiterminator/mannitol/fructose-specific phosphotransferase system IIA component (Ntr-type)
MENRKKELVCLLLKEPRIFSYQELCEYLNISDRLLRYCIDDTNDFLQQHSVSPVKKIRGKGVILELSTAEVSAVEKSLIDDTYLDKESRELLILLSILNDTHKSMAYHFQEQFDVSKSAIDADMRNLRQTCKEFHIKITSTPKEGLRLQGDEWAIRLMLNNIINTKFDILQLINPSSLLYLTLKEEVILEYLDSKFVKKIHQTLQNSLRQLQDLDNALYCAQLTMYFAFWRKRYVSGYRLNTNDTFMRRYKKRHTQEIVCHFLLALGMQDVELIEKNYLDFMIDSLNLQRKQTLSEDWVTCQLLSIQIIDRMSEVRGIPYYNDTSLFENLFPHVCALKKRLLENISVYNPLKNMIEKEYSDIFRDIKLVSKLLKTEFKNPLSDEEVAYLSIHFSASEEKIRNQMKAKYRVVVVCGHGVATGELLAEKIKKKYPFDVIGIVSSYEVPAIARLDADFVLKTTDTKIPMIPSLQVNPMLMTNDYQKIASFIDKHEEIFKNKNKVLENKNIIEEILLVVKQYSKEVQETQLCLALKNILQHHEIKVMEKGKQPMISELLVDSYIQLQQEVGDWQEAIKKVAEPLLQNNVITKSYTEAMIDSVCEYGPYIVIGEGIALAHARPSDGVNELGISVMTLRSPVIFHHEAHDPVSLVFCLAAIDDYAHLKIMATIVKLINQEGKISELSRLNDIQDFKECLYALEK